MNGFPEKLASLMAQKKISQRKLAKLSELSQPSISDLLSGKKSPKGETLIKLAKGLGVSIAVFDESNPETIPAKHAIDRAKEWVSGETMEAALKKYETASPEEQDRRWREAGEKLKSLSPEAREAIAVIIRNLAASQK